MRLPSQEMMNKQRSDLGKIVYMPNVRTIHLRRKP